MSRRNDYPSFHLHPGMEREPRGLTIVPKKPGVCACGEKFVGPPNQRKCKTCREAKPNRRML